MSAGWMLQALVVGLLLGAGAAAAERVARWFDRPARGTWTLAVLGSLLLPALSLWRPGLLPRIGLLPRSPDALAGYAPAAPGRTEAGEAALGMAAAIAGAGGSELPAILGAGWLALSTAMLAVVAWTAMRLRAIRLGAVPAEVDGTRVRVSERAGPAVMGVVRPEIVVPRWLLQLPDDERRLVLLHEREHLARHDPRLLLLGTLAVVAMPWNLPVWWQHRRLRLAVEIDCDARVLARGARRRAYGRALLRMAGGVPGLPLLGPGWAEATSHLERRILTMSENRPPYRRLRSVPLLAVTLGVAAVACDVAGTAAPRAGERLASATAASPAEAPRDTVLSAPSRPHDPTRGSHGIRSRRWPEGQEPRIAPDGRFHAPTGHPTITVWEGGSAWKGGLRDGDVLLAVNGRDIRETDGAPFPDSRLGTRYDVRVRRDGRERDFRVEIGPPSQRRR